MQKKILLLLVFIATISFCSAQTSKKAKSEAAKADSVAHARAVKDSLNMERIFAIAQYPYIKGSKWSGIIPVANPTEIPDPALDYKLLFEITAKNPDSLSKEINQSFDEVARILNLHFASGIPANKIIPVIVIHGPGLEAVSSNDVYQKKHKIDNPNLKLIHDFENAGAKIIVCGQAMEFFEYKKEDLLPEIKISLTAKTVLSRYQLEGYVLNVIVPDK